MSVLIVASVGIFFSEDLHQTAYGALNTFPEPVNDVFLGAPTPGGAEVIRFMKLLDNDTLFGSSTVTSVVIDSFTLNNITFDDPLTYGCPAGGPVISLFNATDVRLDWVQFACQEANGQYWFGGYYVVEDDSSGEVARGTFEYRSQLYLDNFVAANSFTIPDTDVETIDLSGGGFDWVANDVDVLANDVSPHSLTIVDFEITSFTYDGTTFYTQNNYDDNIPRIVKGTGETLTVDLSLIGDKTQFSTTTGINVSYTMSDGHGTFIDGTLIRGTPEYFAFINLVPEENKKGGGGGCSDCTPPTFGWDKNGIQRVENGFVYNGQSVDVTDYHTAFPLINAITGEMNTIKVKVYENQGINSIKVVQFALGMNHVGSPISNSEALIEVHFNNGEVDEVKLINPNNLVALNDEDVSTAIVSCMESSSAECLEVTVSYKYLDQSKHNPVAINSFDTHYNPVTNYLNEGILVSGDSLNEPLTATVAASKAGPLYPENRGLVDLTQTSYKNDE